MKILIDIVHMADVNFYKNAINMLRKNKHEVIISVMDRGKLPQVVERELGKCSIIGKHSKKNLIIKSFYNLMRVIALRNFISKIQPDVVTSFSYYPAAAVFGKGIPSAIFHDDVEYKAQFFLCKFFARKMIIPDFISVNISNARKYHSYKEWAYLNPTYFKPLKSILSKYKLKKNNYIFIRDIASVSLNYKKNNKFEFSSIIPKFLNKNIKIVVSLEDKSEKGKFKDCIILKEPVRDLHSLVFHSLALISSGDTMVREAALLGVPSYYVGDRDMEVNKDLIKIGLIKVKHDEYSLLQEFQEELISKKKAREKMIQFTKKLEDTTRIIVDELVKISN